MSAWGADDLDRIGRADEVEIATRRADGTLRPDRVVWVVRLGDELYLRSVNGRGAAWFRGTRTRMTGRIRADGVEHDIAFVDADDVYGDALDGVYRSKYRRFSGALDRITAPTRGPPPSPSSRQSAPVGSRTEVRGTPGEQGRTMTNRIPVTPTGEYADIEVSDQHVALASLADPRSRGEAVARVLAAPEEHSPPVLMAMASVDLRRRPPRDRGVLVLRRPAPRPDRREPVHRPLGRGRLRGAHRDLRAADQPVGLPRAGDAPRPDRPGGAVGRGHRERLRPAVDRPARHGRLHRHRHRAHPARRAVAVDRRGDPAGVRRGRPRPLRRRRPAADRAVRPAGRA